MQAKTRHMLRTRSRSPAVTFTMSVSLSTFFVNTKRSVQFSGLSSLVFCLAGCMCEFMNAGLMSGWAWVVCGYVCCLWLY